MEKSEVFLTLLEKASLIIVLFILISKTKGLKKMFQKETYSVKDLIIISIIFSGLSILGTIVGIDVEGSIANTRIMTIVSGGVIFGPIVGIVSGFISGVHRYLIDVGGITALPCFISSISSGILSGIFYTKFNSKPRRVSRWVYGIICGVIAESITMLLIYLISTPRGVALLIIKQIYIPMIVGQIGIGFMISTIESIKKEKDEIAAFQSKLTLDIANKTLPYFRNITPEALQKICGIIKEEINSDAVSITDTEHVLTYVGVGEQAFNKPGISLSNFTKESIETNKILNIKVDKDEHSLSEKVNLKTAMIIPLTDSQGVIGTLKIYYTKKYDISGSKKSLAIGLSDMISTLMEISKIEKIKEEKNKAEIKALQTQINPHFLFNALNTITSFIRINPDKARQLIINLSTYMRYNLEISDNLIDIHKELEQVKAYVEIEKARFGDKLEVIYDIEENIEAKIPSLIIQPLVENAIIHGIRQNGGAGTVIIGVRQEDSRTKIWIENDGVTIDRDIINKVYTDSVPENKIGLYNVHLRLKLIYGQGLKIYRLDPGTEIEFYI
ncbi:sensor histidine kinase [Romboutsia weinsteinii]|uniref:Sensor histidine kinase n=1 Tax=Romboutsia weinsteinii TaxID=2020949 RepID=A0A371J721_9FIRM|nr:LytS/YhcK type 5TM receptor domain-containing protein [Romboutsia weinsteinii]RDY28559.1 sensor histidine kinase [Romboutsia weinsteinii]